MKITLAAVQRIQLQRHTWTPTRVKQLKNFIRKKVSAQEIAVMLNMPLDSVQDRIYKYNNSDK